MQNVRPYNECAQFAPVAPIQILEEMLKTDVKRLFGNYHLFLAHHTVAYPERFNELIASFQRKMQFSQLTIIMDNSIVELGGAVDDDMIAEAVNIIKPKDYYVTEVVPCLPDVMGDGAATTALSAEAYDRWTMANNPMPGDGYMVVTQGKTWEDFTDLVNHFFVEKAEYYRNIQWVGIPRKIQPVLGSRARAIQYIQMVAPHVKIHLLGFSEHIADDLFCARMPGVRGIDSAVPVRYPHQLNPMTSDEEIGPRGDWWDVGKLETQAKYNIENVRQWLLVKGR